MKNSSRPTLSPESQQSRGFPLMKNLPPNRHQHSFTHRACLNKRLQQYSDKTHKSCFMTWFDYNKKARVRKWTQITLKLMFIIIIISYVFNT